MTMTDPTQSQTITLPAQDWQTVLAALYELPAKYSVPVITRLQAELHRMPDAATENITTLRGS
jgi:hypothetical protein